jgi:hypothetical protein
MMHGQKNIKPCTKVDVFAGAKIHIALFVVITPCTLFGTDISDVYTAPIFMDLRLYENLKSDRCVFNLCEEPAHVVFITHSYNKLKKLL